MQIAVESTTHDGRVRREVYETTPKLNLERVAQAIGSTILEYCKLMVGGEFHGDDLRAYVKDKGIVCAPSSPDRILRQLKAAGLIRYTLVSRPKSLYRVDWVKEGM